jgi:hypothetical protein
VTELPELGFYTLAGQPRSPRELIEEVTVGESMGFGSAFISELAPVVEAYAAVRPSGRFDHLHANPGAS